MNLHPNDTARINFEWGIRTFQHFLIFVQKHCGDKVASLVTRLKKFFNF